MQRTYARDFIRAEQDLASAKELCTMELVILHDVTVSLNVCISQFFFY